MSAITATTERWPACWAPGQDLVVADVAEQEDELLLAVHRPPELRVLPVPQRGTVPQPGEGQTSNQDDLLDHVVNTEPAQKTLIVPVIGAPGTGKSHLVRWMLAALPERDDLVVRHIPREGTSLPQVVTTIFEGLEGDVFDDLRNAMARSVAADDGRLGQDDRIERVATRLLSRMAEDFEYDEGIRWEVSRNVDDETRRAVAGLLPTLLREQGVLERLRRPGGAAYRLAKLIVEGQDAEEHLSEERLGFTAEDVEDISAVRGMGAAAMRALNVVRMPGQGPIAAAILTDALNHAAPEVIGLRSVSLADLLRVFRQRLHEERKQLLLLFEDIAIARGLQADLVDALTTPGKRPDAPELCILRVVMAVTTTYWEEAPETLASRARGWHAKMFSLDVQREEAEVQATSLIGRYLNAARIGQGVLKERTTEELLAGVENACVDCRFRSQCHPVFGTSADGHGLFPLTAKAAVTLGRLADPGLRPRAVLTEVVSAVVASAEDVTAGRFPQSTAWRRAADEAVTARRLDEAPFAWLSRLDEIFNPEERDRARLVLRVWAEPGEVADPLLRVLGLEMTVDGASEVPARKSPEGSTSRGGTEPKKAHGATDRPSADEEWVNQLQRWGGGAVALTQNPAREARNLVWDALDKGIRWFEIGESEAAVKKLLGLTGVQVQNMAVDLGGTEAGRALSKYGSTLVTLEPTTANASSLIALFNASKGVSLSLDDLARIENLLERGESAARAALKEGPASVAHLTGLAKLLAISALPLSRRLGVSGRPDFGTAMAAVDGAQVEGPRATAWTRAVKEAEDCHRRTLERLTAAMTRTQGRGGAPTVIDHAAVDRKALRNDPYGLRIMTGALQDVRDHAEFLGVLREATVAEGQRLRRDLEAIAAHTGAEDRLPWQSMLTAAEGAIAAAARRHVLGPENLLAQVRDYRPPAADEAAKVVTDAWVAVRAAEKDNLPEAAYRLAMVDTAMVSAMREHLDRMSLVLRESTRSAEAALRAGSTAGRAAGIEIRATVAEMLDRVRSMLP